MLKRRSAWVALALLMSSCSTPPAVDTPSSLAEYFPSEQSASQSGLDIDSALLNARHYSEKPSATYEEQYRLLSSYWQKIATCLNEAGWSGHEVQRPNSPYVTFNTPDVSGQEKEYVDDFIRCQEGTDGFPQEPVASRETAEKVYVSQVDFRTCAVENGYSLAEPPSLESYIDAFLAGRVNWDPQGELLETRQVSAFDMQNFHELCPYWY